MEYAWFNNVETKPGTATPNWKTSRSGKAVARDVNGKIRPRLGRGQNGGTAKIFANPVIPQIDDYYEPLPSIISIYIQRRESKYQPTARPRSILIDGKRMDKVIWGQIRKELPARAENAPATVTSTTYKSEMYGQLEKHLHDVPAAPVRTLPEPQLCRHQPARYL